MSAVDYGSRASALIDTAAKETVLSNAHSHSSMTGP